MKISTAFAILAGIIGTRAHDPGAGRFCHGVNKALASDESQLQSAHTYCSSLLSLPPRETATATVTSQAPATATVYPSTFYSCASKPQATPQRELKRRSAKSDTPKPPAFRAYGSCGQKSAACSCLLPSMANAVTVTSTALQTATETSRPTQTATKFMLQAHEGAFARVDTRQSRSNSVFFDAEAEGPPTRSATIFTLSAGCELVVADSGPFSIRGHQAMQATRAGTDAVVFEHPNSAENGYSPILCEVEAGSHHLLCALNSEVPNAGSLGTRADWRLGTTSKVNFTIIAQPVLEQNSRASSAAENASMNEIRLLAGQEVLQ